MNLTDSKQGSQLSLPDQLPVVIAKSHPSLSEEGSVKLVKPKVVVGERRSRLLKRILTPKIKVSKPYFTAAKRINDSNRRCLQSEPSPFAYPGDMEEFAQKVLTKAWRDDVLLNESKLKCAQRPSYKDRQKRDLLNRLYVTEPTLKTVRTTKDLDPHYFSIIEGRPIPDKVKIGDYIELVRESLRTKIITGYREDDIMLIDENLLLEQKMIDDIKSNYQIYVNTFEEFLYKDHTSAMALLKESEEAAVKAYDMWEEYRAISKKYGALRSSLFNLEEKWRNCKTYQKFLYTVSPMSWRAEQKAYKRASVYMMEEDPDDDENIFGRYRTSISEKAVSLSDILRQFREELNDEQPPQLFFSTTEELMDVFRFMEIQNLNSLLHSEELAVPLDNVKDGMKKAVDMFDMEIRNLQEIIDKLEGGIKWEEQRVIFLEEVALSLIENEFKKLVKDDETLNLHTFVEDVFETRIAPNDANLSIVEMMRGIEEKYRNELLFLDKIPSDQVAQLEGTFYAEQVMVMRLAEKAAKQYAELERLTNSLNKAFAPRYEKPMGKDLKKRSPPVNPPKKVEPPPRSLTQNEADYLEFFTDFCIYTDDPGAYGININPQEEEDGERVEIFDFNDEAKVEDGRKLLTIASEILNAQSIIKRH